MREKVRNECGDEGRLIYMDILCVQETRWKGSKVRSTEGRFKLFYYGVDRKRNGAEAIL